LSKIEVKKKEKKINKWDVLIRVINKKNKEEVKKKGI
jgi:hypothetical protein